MVGGGGEEGRGEEESVMAVHDVVLLRVVIYSLLAYEKRER